jgi:hypothetical protein
MLYPSAQVVELIVQEIGTELYRTVPVDTAVGAGGSVYPPVGGVMTPPPPSLITCTTRVAIWSITSEVSDEPKESNCAFVTASDAVVPAATFMSLWFPRLKGAPISLGVEPSRETVFSRACSILRELSFIT